MNCKQSKLRDAVLIALAVGASSTSGVVFAQESGAATNLDKVQVTGSRIRSVDVETSQPVLTLTRSNPADWPHQRCRSTAADRHQWRRHQHPVQQRR